MGITAAYQAPYIKHFTSISFLTLPRARRVLEAPNHVVLWECHTIL